jgi:hypothetical protein
LFFFSVSCLVLGLTRIILCNWSDWIQNGVFFYVIWFFMAEDSLFLSLKWMGSYETNLFL